MDRRLFLSVIPSAYLPLGSAEAASRAAPLPDGYDLDDLTGSGAFLARGPHGAPADAPGPWAVTSSVFAEAALQQIAPLSAPGSCWRRSRDTRGWAPWTPVGGFVSPEHFGAAGDGAADDSRALEAALRSDFPVLLHGAYRITREVRAARGRSLSLQGQGERHIFLDGPEAGIVWDAGLIDPYQRASFTARDFTIVSRRRDHRTAALSLVGEHGSGSTASTFHMENVRTEGADDDSACQTGFHLVNMRNGLMLNCSHQGRRAGALTGRGIHCEGAGDPVDFALVSCNLYFCDRAIDLGGSHEGISIDRLTAVAVNYGVYCDLDETVPEGDDNGKPLIKVTNSHVNFRVAGILFRDTRDFYIGANDFLFDKDVDGATAISVEARSRSSLYGHVGPNKIDASNYRGARAIGVMTKGHRTGALAIVMDAQRYVLVDVGLWLNDDTRGLTYSSSDIYAGVKRPILRSRYGVDAIRMTAPPVSG